MKTSCLRFKDYTLLKEGVTYKLPATPRVYMADFYMLSFLKDLNFTDISYRSTSKHAQGFAGALRGHDYKEDIDYAVTLLYPALQKIIIKDSFFSICCEASHALRIMAGDEELPKSATSPGRVPKWYNKIALAYNAMYSGDELDENRSIRSAQNKGFNKYEVHTKYIKELLAKYGVSDEEFVRANEIVFNDEDFWMYMESYGGKAWGAICSGWLHLAKVEPTNYTKLATYIDHMYDLQHNNGSVFTKIKEYHRSKPKDFGDYQQNMEIGFEWITELLDYKAAIKNPYDLINRCSSLMQKLASPVLKAAGYSRQEMSNPEERYHATKQGTEGGVWEEYWTDSKGNINRGNDKPARITHMYGDKTNGDYDDKTPATYIWMKHGYIYREGDKPAQVDISPVGYFYNPDETYDKIYEADEQGKVDTNFTDRSLGIKNGGSSSFPKPPASSINPFGTPQAVETKPQGSYNNPYPVNNPIVKGAMKKVESFYRDGKDREGRYMPERYKTLIYLIDRDTRDWVLVKDNYFRDGHKVISKDEFNKYYDVDKKMSPEELNAYQFEIHAGRFIDHFMLMIGKILDHYHLYMSGEFSRHWDTKGNASPASDASLETRINNYYNYVDQQIQSNFDHFTTYNLDGLKLQDLFMPGTEKEEIEKLKTRLTFILKNYKGNEDGWEEVKKRETNALKFIANLKAQHLIANPDQGEWKTNYYKKKEFVGGH